MEQFPNNNNPEENTNQEPTGADILANMPSFEEMRRQNATPEDVLPKNEEQAHEQVSGGDMAGSQAEKEQQAAVDNSAQTQQNNQEAISHADDTASERANTFENGDF